MRDGIADTWPSASTTETKAWALSNQGAISATARGSVSNVAMRSSMPWL